MTTPTVEETIAFAVATYAGHEPDKGGAPYVLHPLRVMLAMHTDEERRVAVLHDVIEDCGVTADELRARGHPGREVEAVLAVTRDKARETYEEFIERLRPNALARRVKLADLADNLDVTRLRAIDDAARERLDRYLHAWRRLCGDRAEPASAAVTEPAPTQVESSNTWEKLQRELAEALAVLQENHCLIVSAKQSNHFVQFSADASEVRAEAVSNNYLKATESLGPPEIEALVRMGWNPPSSKPGERCRDGASPNFHRDFAAPISAAELARFAVRTLSEVFQLAHPDQLEYRAFDWRTGDEILLPTLRLKRTRRPPPPPPREQTHAEVREIVLAAVRRASGEASLAYDADGDIVVRFGSALVYVRVNEKPPFVRVYAPVARNVPVSDALLQRLNGLNARARLVHFFWDEGVVLAGVDVFGLPVVGRHVLHACGVVGEAVEQLEELMERDFGGRTGSGEYHPVLKN